VVCPENSTRASIHNRTCFVLLRGYGGGTSERRLRDIRQRLQSPSGLLVATKFLPTIWRLTRSAFFKSLRGSLKRLGVNCIDLYFIHTPIHPVRLEFWVQCCCDAAKQGLIRDIGLSNCNAAQVRRAAKVMFQGVVQAVEHVCPVNSVADGM